MSIDSVLKALKIPLLLIIYGIAWIALQPLLIRTIILTQNTIQENINGNTALGVLLSILYILLNGLWLISWYRMAKRIRNSYLKLS